MNWNSVENNFCCFERKIRNKTQIKNVLLTLKLVIYYQHFRDFGNFRERGAKKAFTSEVFDSIIAECKEGLENVHFKGNKSKNLEAEKKQNW